MPKIITRYSTTASAVPTTGDLEIGELAVNLTDKKLYSKLDSSTVVTIAERQQGSWVQIGASQAPSAVASVDFTSASYTIDSTYSEIMFVFDKVAPANDGVGLACRLSTDGSAFLSTSVYAYANSAGTGAGTVASGTTLIALSPGALGNATNESGFTGYMVLSSPSSAVARKTGYIFGSYVNQSGVVVAMDGYGFQFLSTDAVLGAQFLMSAGNIASGTITLYGRRA